MIQETPQAERFKPSRSRNTTMSTLVETAPRRSTSSKADRSNCSCFRRKGKSVFSPSKRREIFLANCACPG